MRVYITLLGRSVWALLNCYYAVLKEKGYVPDVIYVIGEDLFAESMQKAVKGLKILSEGFGIAPAIKEMVVREARFVEAGASISSLIKGLRENGCRIAIDITPARKALVAAALLSLSRRRIDHVFYLAIREIKGMNLPYEMIPKQMQSLKDFEEEVRRKEGALAGGNH